VLTKRQCIIDFCHELNKSLHTLLCLAAKEFGPPVRNMGDVCPHQVTKRRLGSTENLRCVQDTGFLRRKRKPVSLLTPGSHLVPYHSSVVCKQQDHVATIRPQPGSSNCIDARVTSIPHSRSFEGAALRSGAQGFSGRPAMVKHVHEYTPHKKLRQLVPFRAINSLTGLKLAYSRTAGGDADVRS